MIKVASARLVKDQAVIAREVLWKTLPDVVLPLNAVATQTVTVGTSMRPLYSAHLCDFDQSSSLRDQSLRDSTTTSGYWDFWFRDALQREQETWLC